MAACWPCPAQLTVAASRSLLLPCGGAGAKHPLSLIADDIAADEAAWQAYYEHEAPESAPLPHGYNSVLSQFEQLLLLRCLRVDRVTVAITQFVMSTLGGALCDAPGAGLPRHLQAEHGNHTRGVCLVTWC